MAGDQNNSANEAQIRQLVETWAQAVRDRDTDAILAHHSADIVMYDVPPPFQSTGMDEYRSTWDTFYEGTQPGVFDIKELHIMAGEDVAFCYATMMCSTKDGGAHYTPLDFRLTIGLKKIDGQWTIMHEHHSIPAE